MAIRHMKRFSTLLIPHVGIYLEKSKILIRKDTHTPMFTVALFTIAKTWKHSKCSSTDEWIKMWYVCGCTWIVLGKVN